MSKHYFSLYNGMSKREALEAFFKNHISEGDETECGYIANKISQYLENSMEREDINTFVEEEVEDYKEQIEDLTQRVNGLEFDISEKENMIEDLERELGEYKRSEGC